MSAYQPLYGIELRDTPEIRPVLARWAAMEPHLPTSGSALDVGCLNGWFTFKLAQRGLTALGVDTNERSLCTAQLLAIRGGHERAGFARLTLDPFTAEQLPSFDVVLCLSVFHHLVRFQGSDAAEAILKALAERTTRQLYFETGQPNETTEGWHDKLSFMGDDPSAWIVSFLASLGFDQVNVLASLPGFKTDQPRALVMASRD